MRHPSPANLTAFVRGELPEAELFEIGDHVAGCDECADQSERVVSMPTRREWSEWRPDPLAAGHIDDERLLAYVRGQCSAADRRVLEEHVAACRLCRDDLADLENFHARMAPTAGRLFAPDTPAPRALTPRELFGRVLGSRWLPAVAAAGIAGLAVFYLGMEPLRTRLQGERSRAQQLAQQVQRAEELRQELEQRLATAPDSKTDPRVAELGKQLAAARARERALDQRLAALQRSPQGNAPAMPVAAAEALARQALRSGKLRIAADIQSLQGQSGRLLGGNEEQAAFAPARPLGTAVRGQTPVFRWRPFPGATGYRVMIFDEAFNEAGRGEVQGTVEWRPETPLARGKTYHWEVVALKNGEELERAPRPPAPPARFRVLEARAAASLARMRLATPLERGVSYAGFGLLDEAQRELETAAEEAATPVERKRVERLLNQVQSIRTSR